MGRRGGRTYPPLVLLLGLRVSSANITPTLNFAVPSEFTGKPLKVLTRADISLVKACVQLAVLSTMNSTLGNCELAGLLKNKAISSARAAHVPISKALARTYFVESIFLVDSGLMR